MQVSCNWVLDWINLWASLACINRGCQLDAAWFQGKCWSSYNWQQRISNQNTLIWITKWWCNRVHEPVIPYGENANMPCLAESNCCVRWNHWQEMLQSYTQASRCSVCRMLNLFTTLALTKRRVFNYWCEIIHAAVPKYSDNNICVFII